MNFRCTFSEIFVMLTNNRASEDLILQLTMCVYFDINLYCSALKHFLVRRTTVLAMVLWAR